MYENGQGRGHSPGKREGIAGARSKTDEVVPLRCSYSALCRGGCTDCGLPLRAGSKGSAVVAGDDATRRCTDAGAGCHVMELELDDRL